MESRGASWRTPEPAGTSPEDSSALCNAVLEAFRNQDNLECMGMRGRDYVLHYYDRRVLAAQYLQLLATL